VRDADSSPPSSAVVMKE